jgi:hypothetical protein
MILREFHRLCFEVYIRFLTMMNFSFKFVTFYLGFPCLKNGGWRIPAGKAKSRKIN